MCSQAGHTRAAPRADRWACRRRRNAAAPRRRDLRQRIQGVPVGVLDLVGLLDDLAAHPLGRVGHHQAVRERPALAAVVAQVLHLHAHFFGHLAVQALLQRLAGLDEAGQRAVDARHVVRRAREQHFISVGPHAHCVRCPPRGLGRLGAARRRPAPHQRHDRRAQARVGGVAAGGALAGTLVALQLGGRAAGAAEAVGAVPLQHLRGAAGHTHQRLAEGHHRGAQRHALEARRRLVQREGPAIDAIELAEVVACRLQRLEQRPRARPEHGALALLGQQQLAFDENKAPRVGRGG